MNKRIIACLLTIMLCINILPAYAMADDFPVQEEEQEFAAEEDTLLDLDEEGPAVILPDDVDIQTDEKQNILTEEEKEEVKKADADELIDSGNCDGVPWKLTATGVLLIGESGQEYTFAYRDETAKWPWEQYLNTAEVVSVDFLGTVHGNGNHSGMFSCTAITSIDLSGFDTSAVTDMNSMFMYCESLSSIDLSGFNTHAVTNMTYMFYSCTSLRSLNLSSFDTSSVKSMNNMFSYCRSLENVNLNGFDTNETTDMREMFFGCNSLTSLDMSGFDTHAVTDMVSMFDSCSSLTTLDLSSFDTSAMLYCSNMFFGCNALKTIYVSNTWSANNETLISSDNMFWGCESLVGDGASYDMDRIDGTMANCETGYLTLKASLEQEVTIIEQGTCGDNLTWKLDDEGTLTISGSGSMSDFTTSGYEPWFDHRAEIKNAIIQDGVTSIGNYAFFYCECLVSVELSKDLVSIGNYAFSHCKSLEALSQDSLSKEEKLSTIGDYAFSDCSSLKELILPSNITHLGEYLIKGTMISEIKIPKTLTSVNKTFANGYNGPFAQALSLKRIEFEEGLVEIPDAICADSAINWATYSHVQLETVYIPESVQRIGQHSFDCEKSFKIVGKRGSFAETYANENDIPFEPLDGEVDLGGFDCFKYRADYYLNNLSANCEARLFESSPSLELYEDGKREGLADSVMEWEGFMNLMNSIDDPSSIPDTGIKKKDIYTALIFDILEASQDDGVIEELDVSNAKLADSLFGYLKQLMKTTYDIELAENIGDFSSLTQVQKENLYDWSKEWVKKETKFFQGETELFSKGLELFDYIKDISEWCNYLSSAITMRYMSDSLKNVVRDMQEACPQQNIDLQLALLECCTILNESDAEFEAHMIGTFYGALGKEIGQYCISEYWSSVKASASVSNPYVAVYWAAYSGSKLLCNTLLSTDSISENYFTMDAILQIEGILDTVYNNYKERYNTDQTSENAEALLTVLDTMFCCFRVDCDVAYKFVDVVDTATVSRIAQFFGESDASGLKGQIKRIQQSMNGLHHNVLILWAAGLQDDYPDEYDYYSDLLKINIKECDIQYGASSYIYLGQEIIPPVSLSIYGMDLVKDEDYQVEFSNNINVGTATLTIIGIGDRYTGSVQKTFEIIPCNLSNTTVEKISNYTYNGSALKPAPTVKNGTVTLKSGTDYSLSYKNNKNAGTATITITGKGNYTGTKTATFNINKAAQTITVKTAASSVAVGKTTTITVDGAMGTKSYTSSDKTIVTVSSTGTITAKKVGTVKITVSAGETANYKASAAKTVTIKVLPAATSSITATNLATGMKVTWKKVTGATGYYLYRKAGSGSYSQIKKITSGSTISYTDKAANTNGTKYTYKVVAYAGTGKSTLSKALATYRLTRPSLSSLTSTTAKMMTAKWGKNSKATGYEIQFSLKKDFSTVAKKKSIDRAATVTYTQSGLTSEKTYYVRIRTYKYVNGTKYYSAWSAVKSLKVK